MYEIIGTAMVLMGVALVIETIITLFTIRANNESYDRYIAEINHSQDLEEKLKEKESQLEGLANIIREVSEGIEDGE